MSTQMSMEEFRRWLVGAKSRYEEQVAKEQEKLRQNTKPKKPAPPKTAWDITGYTAKDWKAGGYPEPHPVSGKQGRWIDYYLPEYGASGGADYSGGHYELENGGKPGPDPALDDLDRLFEEHDRVYRRYGITPKTSNSSCERIKDPAERERCLRKRAADENLRSGLVKLDRDPSKWENKPSDPAYARLYRFAALKVFPWPDDPDVDPPREIGGRWPR